MSQNRDKGGSNVIETAWFDCCSHPVASGATEGQRRRSLCLRKHDNRPSLCRIGDHQLPTPNFGRNLDKDQLDCERRWRGLQHSLYGTNNSPAPNYPSCLAVNVNAQSRTLQVEVIDGNGQVQAIVGPLVIQPGHRISVATTPLISFPNDFYCKFTVSDGTSSDIRGTIQVCSLTACGQVAVAAPQ